MDQPGAFVNFKDLNGIDCCTSDPDNYKVVAELPNARLIEMKLAPGAEDHPHVHPVHSMYVIVGGKLQITHPDPTDPAKNAVDVVEIPSGAPPIMPSGPHQVKNIGDTEVHIIFCEVIL
jgi:quercetin dioxygenase-like cupin family protein